MDRIRLRSFPIIKHQFIHFAASWVDKCPQGRGSIKGGGGVGRNKLLGSSQPFPEQLIHHFDGRCRISHSASGTLDGRPLQVCWKCWHSQCLGKVKVLECSNPQNLMAESSQRHNAVMASSVLDNHGKQSGSVPTVFELQSVAVGRHRTTNAGLPTCLRT